MSSWQPGARERLERPAIELFAAQGFAATTVPQITARAGLTTRTFFRHFADKREVLFGGEEIPESAARLIADAPASLDPVTLITGGLQTVTQTRFDGRGVDARTAALLAESTVTVLNVAIDEWLASGDDSRTLSEIIPEALQSLRAALAPGRPGLAQSSRRG